MRADRIDRSDENFEEEDARTIMWEEVSDTARELFQAMVDFLNENHYIKFSDYGSPCYLYAENVTFTMDRLENYDVSPNISVGNSYEVIGYLREYRIPWKDTVDCHNLAGMISTNSWLNISVITREEFEEKTAEAVTLDEAEEKRKAIEEARNKAKRSCTNIRRNNPKYQHIKNSIKQFQLYVKFLKNLKEKFDGTIYQEAFSENLPPELVKYVHPNELGGRDFSWVESYNSGIKQEILRNGGIPDVDLL
jgi:DnaJ-domain-containing protein 1